MAGTKWMIAAAVLVFGATAWWACGLTADLGHAGVLWALTIVIAGGPAVLWLLGAWGLGLAIERVRRGAEPADPVVAAGVGIAAALVVDAILARSGALSFPIVAWAVPIAGAALALVFRPRGTIESCSPPLIAAMIPLAVLFVAACSAPGWLWSTEFGGYDALSYHLQLPAEWLATGRQTGLEHNVYSFLPGYVESTYLHLFAMGGDTVSPQLLHAGLAVVAALVCTRLVRATASRSLATMIVLGTPWVVVTGSLAYNDMAVVLGLATGWCIARDLATGGSWRDGVVLGLVLGAAMGAKPTAVGLVALPVGLVAILSGSDLLRPRIGRLAIGAMTAALVLAPWFATNAMSTGNPVFPFLAGTMPGHWTEAQAARWAGGHHAPPNLIALWDEFLRFGIGPKPTGSGRWIAQWSILPALTIIATGIALARRTLREEALGPLVILVVQIGFWLLATHQKSRFLLPAVIPMAVLIARVVAPMMRTPRAGWIALIPALAWCIVPAVLYARDGGEAPSAAIGTEDQFRESGAAQWMNEAQGAHVLLVGDAAPFYYEQDNFVYATVWDSLAADSFDALVAGERGTFTHVLVDYTMLNVWAQSGWSDTRLDAERVRSALTSVGDEVARFGGGKVLYEVNSPNAR